MCRQFVANLWMTMMCVAMLAAVVLFCGILIVIPIHYVTIWAMKQLNLEGEHGQRVSCYYRT